MEKKINVKIDYSKDVFFTDSYFVIYSPKNFVFDFKQSTPRMDTIDNERKQTIVVKHEPIVMDPVLAKMLLQSLSSLITDYEKKHGKIKLPKQIVPKKTKEQMKGESATYIG